MPEARVFRKMKLNTTPQLMSNEGGEGGGLGGAYACFHWAWGVRNPLSIEGITLKLDDLEGKTDFTAPQQPMMQSVQYILD